MQISPLINSANNDEIKSYKLETYDLNQAQLLHALKPLFGCIYLQNQQYPVIGILPVEYLVSLNQQLVTYTRDENLNYQVTKKTNNIQDFIQLQANDFKHDDATFQGGYMGFIDYNFAALQKVENIQKNQPNLCLGCYESFIRFDAEQCYFYSLEPNAIADRLLAKINQCLAEFKPKHCDQLQISKPCTARWTNQQYQQAFQKIQDYIQAGDCYQINLTQEFTATAQGSLISTAADFWQLTQAPYAGYLNFQDFELLSCSPELFIEFSNNRQISTKPIKGTMPRFSDPKRDQQSKLHLQNSEKDRAENVMIVDLLRNDLSVFAEVGTVKTPQLFEIESFNQVHHMVSEITALLKPEVHPFDVLLASLPGGSITGAPKIRAMQIIEELEGAPRGAYCGSLGYFNFDGTGSWNILIRSLQKYQDQVSVWAGGGITIASDCAAEYQECFDKVSAILDLLNSYKPKHD